MNQRHFKQIHFPDRDRVLKAIETRSPNSPAARPGH